MRKLFLLPLSVFLFSGLGVSQNGNVIRASQLGESHSVIVEEGKFTTLGLTDEMINPLFARHTRTFSGTVSAHGDVTTTAFNTSSSTSSVVASFNYRRLHNTNTQFSVILQRRVNGVWRDQSWQNFTATLTSQTGQAAFRNVGTGEFRVIATSPDSQGASISGTVTYN